MSDIDQFFTTPIHRLDSAVCRLVLERCIHGHTYENRYMINYINTLYGCHFKTTRPPFTSFQSCVLERVRLYESRFSSMRKIEIANMYYSSKDIVMHLVSLRHLIHQSTTFDLFTAFHRSAPFIRGGIRFDIVAQVVQGHPVQQVVHDFRHVYLRDTFFHALCAAYNWDIETKLTDITIRTLLSLRQLLYAVCPKAHDSVVYSIQSYMLSIRPKQTMHPVEDVLVQYYLSNELENLFVHVSQRLDQVCRMCKSKRGGKIVYDVLCVLLGYCRHNYARRQFLQTLATLVLNDLCAYTTGQFAVHTGIPSHDSECCICMDPFRVYHVVCKTCSHAIHEHCALEYIRVYPRLKCPMCRSTGHVSDIRGDIGLI